MDDERTNVMWGSLVLKGIASILFGIAAVFWPGLTLVTLVYLFSAYILVLGLVDIVLGILHMGRRPTWFLTLVLGLALLGVGVYLVRHPGVSFQTLLLLIGFSLVGIGLFEVVRAFSDREAGTERMLNVVGGAAGLVAGILLLFQPVEGGVAFVWLLGLYALITGPLMIALSVGARDLLDGRRRRAA